MHDKMTINKLNPGTPGEFTTLVLEIYPEGEGFVTLDTSSSGKVTLTVFHPTAKLIESGLASLAAEACERSGLSKEVVG